jgi:hypothetical protein
MTDTRARMLQELPVVYLTASYRMCSACLLHVVRRSLLREISFKGDPLGMVLAR